MHAIVKPEPTQIANDPSAANSISQGTLTVRRLRCRFMVPTLAWLFIEADPDSRPEWHH